MTFQASCGMSVRSHMMRKYSSPGTKWCEMSRGRGHFTCCSFMLALYISAPMSHLSWEVLSCDRLAVVIFSLSLSSHAVDKVAVFWQLGGNALSVCTYRTLMEMCHPSTSLGLTCICSLCNISWFLIAVRRAAVCNNPSYGLRMGQMCVLRTPKALVLVLLNRTLLWRF